MKKLNALLAILALALFVGCTGPQQRITVNTLSSLHTAVDGAVASYFALVAEGAVSTNDVPAVAKDYRDFQTAFNLAVTAAQSNPNTPATPEVQAAASKVLAATGKK